VSDEPGVHPGSGEQRELVARCRAVARLGPGSLQSWAADVIEVLREARQAVDDAPARGDPALDGQLLAKLRERYDQAVAFGITHNRHRDWHQGNHPGYALGCWLRDYKEQVWLFTTQFAVDWTNNCSEQAVKAAKRHQAVSGYWHTPGPRPLVPRPQLPRLGGKPRHDRPRRYYPSPCRRPLATSASPLSRDPDAGGEQNPLPLT